MTVLLNTHDMCFGWLINKKTYFLVRTEYKHTFWILVENNVDPEQTALSDASCSRSTILQKKDPVGLSRTRFKSYKSILSQKYFKRINYLCVQTVGLLKCMLLRFPSCTNVYIEYILHLLILFSTS